jgi:hypothetical protein
MSPNGSGGPLQRLSLPALYLVVAALWTVLQLVFSDRAVTPVSVVVHALGGLVFAAILTAGVGLRRRRLGGADASIEYLRAVRSGVVPQEADTDRWPAELDRTARTTVRQRWIIRIGALLPFALGIWGATEQDSRLLGVLLAVLAVAAVVVGELSSRRQLARVTALRSTLAR